MLCPKCEDVRFPLMQTSSCVESVGGDNSHLRKAHLSSHRSVKQASKQSVTIVCPPSSGSGDTAATCIVADAAADALVLHPHKAQDGNLTTNSELDSLRQLVSNQQNEICRLQSRLNFVLSFLGITEGDSTIPVDGNLDSNLVAEGRTLEHLRMPGSVHGSSSVDPSVSCEQWSTVVSKHSHRRTDTLQQSVVAAVYVDQERKKRRETSLIVTGLPPVAGKIDKELFVDLCSSELNVMPDVVSVKRLGHAQSKVQPLLVYLKLADEAKKIINSAKLLRRSSVPVVRDSVYINQNLTKAEAVAAYQVRVQRRLHKQRKENGNPAPYGNQTAFEQNGQSNPLIVPTKQQDSDSNIAASLNPQANPFMPIVAAPSTPSSPSSD